MRKLTSNEAQYISGGAITQEESIVLFNVILDYQEECQMKANKDGFFVGFLVGAPAAILGYMFCGENALASASFGLGIGALMYNVGYHQSQAWSHNW